MTVASTSAAMPSRLSLDSNPESTTSSTSSTSSSLLNISGKSRAFGLRSFFTASSARSRTSSRKKRRAAFRSKNSSSSSVDSDLAYGTGYIPKDNEPSPRPAAAAATRHSAHQPPLGPDGHPALRRAQTDEEILELGRQLSAYAKVENVRDLERAGRPRPSRLAGMAQTVSQFRRQNSSGNMDRGIGSSRPHRPNGSGDESDWESAWESSDDSSGDFDPGLAYGSAQFSHPHLPSGSRPAPPVAPTKPPGEVRSPTWRNSAVDPALFGPFNSLRGFVNTPCGFRPTEYQPPQPPSRFDEPIPQQSSASIDARPMQRVIAEPTSDPNKFVTVPASVISGPPEPPIARSRPDHVPIQAPKPIAPVSTRVLEEKTPLDDLPHHHQDRSTRPSRRRSGRVGFAEAVAAVTEASRRAEGEQGRREPETRRRWDAVPVPDERRETRGDDGRKDDEVRDAAQRPRRSRREGVTVVDDRGGKEPSREEKERREEVRRELARLKAELEYEKEKAAKRLREREAQQAPVDSGREKRDRNRKGEGGAADRTDARRGEDRDLKRSGQPGGAQEEYRAVGESGADSSKVPIDPFQYQVDDDAFPTPANTTPKRPLTPMVFKVVREPKFADDDDEEGHHAVPETRSLVAGEQRLSRRDSFEIEVAESERRREKVERSASSAEPPAISQDASPVEHHTREKEPVRDPVQEAADQHYREKRMARKMKEEEIRSRSVSPDPSVVGKWADEEEPVTRIVTPPEMTKRPKKSLYDAPNADVRIDHVIEPKHMYRFRAPEGLRSGPDVTPQFTSRDPSCERERPLLNIVRPTPVPSPAPEKRAAKAAKAAPKPVQEKAEEEAPGPSVMIGPKDEIIEAPEAPVSEPKSAGAAEKDGEREHNVAEETHHSHERSPPETSVKADVKPRSVPAKKSTGWGALAMALVGAGAVTAVAKDGESSEPKTGEEKTERRSRSPPADHPPMTEPEAPSSSSRALDNDDDRNDTPPQPGPKPQSPRNSEIPGSFVDDLDFTATLAAGLQSSGFDPNIVIDDPTYSRRSSPPGSDHQRPFAETGHSVPRASESGFVIGEAAETPASEREAPSDNWDAFSNKKDKKNKRKKKASEAQSDDIGVPEPVVEESTSEPRSITQPDDDFAEPKQSKKKQKKRGKPAKAEAEGDESFVSWEPESEPVARDAVGDEWPEDALSKKEQKKLHKAVIHQQEEEESLPAQEPDPEPAAHDVAGDDWPEVKLTKKEQRRREKAAMARDLEVEEPTLKPEDEVEPTPPADAGGDDADEGTDKKLTKKEKKKREKAAKSRAMALESEETTSTTREAPQGEEPVEVVETDNWAGGRTKKSNKSKKSRKSAGSWADAYEDAVASGENQTVSVSVDAFDDLQRGRDAEPIDEWHLAEESQEHPERFSFASEPRDRSAQSSEVSPGDSGDKEENHQRTKYDLDTAGQQEPRDASDDYYKPIDRDVTSVVSEPLRHDNQYGSRRNGDGDHADNADDTRSLASAPPTDDKGGTSREKDSSGGFFGFLKKTGGADSQKDETDEPSFLANAGTLGTGVGLAGALALAAAEMYRSNATHAPREKEEPSTDDQIVDPEIVHRVIKPAIDPQYGDLLPLPPSEPGSPNPDLDDLPDLPESRPDTPPEQERKNLRVKTHARRRSAFETPTKSPSQTAVPIHFRLGQRSVPSSPGTPRSLQPHSPGPPPPPEFGSVPKSRSRPNSWGREIMPLYLVEKASSGTLSSDFEANLPELPPSEPSSSRESPSPEYEEREGDVDYLSLGSFPSLGDLRLDTALAAAQAAADSIGSQEATPKAEVAPSLDGLARDAGEVESVQGFHSARQSPTSQSPVQERSIGNVLVRSPPVKRRIESLHDEHEPLPAETPTKRAGEPEQARDEPVQVDPMTKDRSSYLLYQTPPSAKTLASAGVPERSPSPSPSRKYSGKGSSDLDIAAGVAAGLFGTDLVASLLHDDKSGREGEPDTNTSPPSRALGSDHIQLETVPEEAIGRPVTKPDSPSGSAKSAEEMLTPEELDLVQTKKNKKGKKGRKARSPDVVASPEEPTGSQIPETQGEDQVPETVTQETRAAEIQAEDFFEPLSSKKKKKKQKKSWVQDPTLDDETPEQAQRQEEPALWEQVGNESAPPVEQQQADDHPATLQRSASTSKTGKKKKKKGKQAFSWEPEEPEDPPRDSPVPEPSASDFVGESTPREVEPPSSEAALRDETSSDLPLITQPEAALTDPAVPDTTEARAADADAGADSFFTPTKKVKKGKKGKKAQSTTIWEPEGLAIGGPSSEEPVFEQIESERPVLDEDAPPEEPTSERPAPEQATPETASSEAAIPVELATKEPPPEESALEVSTPNEHSPDIPVLGEPTSDTPALEEPASKDLLPEDTIHVDSTTEKLTSEEPTLEKRALDEPASDVTASQVDTSRDLEQSETRETLADLVVDAPSGHATATHESLNEDVLKLDGPEGDDDLVQQQQTTPHPTQASDDDKPSSSGEVVERSPMPESSAPSDPSLGIAQPGNVALEEAALKRELPTSGGEVGQVSFAEASPDGGPGASDAPHSDTGAVSTGDNETSRLASALVLGSAVLAIGGVIVSHAEEARGQLAPDTSGWEDAGEEPPEGNQRHGPMSPGGTQTPFQPSVGPVQGPGMDPAAGMQPRISPDEWPHDTTGGAPDTAVLMPDGQASIQDASTTQALDESQPCNDTVAEEPESLDQSRPEVENVSSDGPLAEEKAVPPAETETRTQTPPAVLDNSSPADDTMDWDQETGSGKKKGKKAGKKSRQKSETASNVLEPESAAAEPAPEIPASSTTDDKQSPDNVQQDPCAEPSVEPDADDLWPTQKGKKGKKGKKGRTKVQDDFDEPEPSSARELGTLDSEENAASQDIHGESQQEQSSVRGPADHDEGNGAALPVEPSPKDDWFEPTGKKGKKGKKAKQSTKGARADFTAVEETSTSEPAQAPEEAGADAGADAGDQAVPGPTESPAEVQDDAKSIEASADDLWGMPAAKGKKGKKGKSARQSMKEPIPEPAAAAVEETPEPSQPSEETQTEDVPDLGQTEPPSETKDEVISEPEDKKPVEASADDLWEVPVTSGKKGKKGKKAKQSIKDPWTDFAAVEESPEASQPSEEPKVEDATDLAQPETINEAVEVATPEAEDRKPVEASADDIWEAPITSGKKGKKGKKAKQNVKDLSADPDPSAPETSTSEPAQPPEDVETKEVPGPGQAESAPATPEDAHPEAEDKKPVEASADDLWEVPVMSGKKGKKGKKARQMEDTTRDFPAIKEPTQAPEEARPDEDLPDQTPPSADNPEDPDAESSDKKPVEASADDVWEVPITSGKKGKNGKKGRQMEDTTPDIPAIEGPAQPTEEAKPGDPDTESGDKKPVEASADDLWEVPTTSGKKGKKGKKGKQSAKDTSADLSAIEETRAPTPVQVPEEETTSPEPVPSLEEAEAETQADPGQMEPLSNVPEVEDKQPVEALADELWEVPTTSGKKGKRAKKNSKQTPQEPSSPPAPSESSEPSESAPLVLAQENIPLETPGATQAGIPEDQSRSFDVVEPAQAEPSQDDLWPEPVSKSEKKSKKGKKQKDSAPLVPDDNALSVEEPQQPDTAAEAVPPPGLEPISSTDDTQEGSGNDATQSFEEFAVGGKKSKKGKKNRGSLAMVEDKASTSKPEDSTLPESPLDDTAQSANTPPSEPQEDDSQAVVKGIEEPDADWFSTPKKGKKGKKRQPLPDILPEANANLDDYQQADQGGQTAGESSSKTQTVDDQFTMPKKGKKGKKNRQSLAFAEWPENAQSPTQETLDVAPMPTPKEIQEEPAVLGSHDATFEDAQSQTREVQLDTTPMPTSEVPERSPVLAAHEGPLSSTTVPEDRNLAGDDNTIAHSTEDGTDPPVLDPTQESDERPAVCDSTPDILPTAPVTISPELAIDEGTSQLAASKEVAERAMTPEQPSTLAPETHSDELPKDGESKGHLGTATGAEDVQQGDVLQEAPLPAAALEPSATEDAFAPNTASSDDQNFDTELESGFPVPLKKSKKKRRSTLQGASDSPPEFSTSGEDVEEPEASSFLPTETLYPSSAEAAASDSRELDDDFPPSFVKRHKDKKRKGRAQDNFKPLTEGALAALKMADPDDVLEPTKLSTILENLSEEASTVGARASRPQIEPILEPLPEHPTADQEGEADKAKEEPTLAGDDSTRDAAYEVSVTDDSPAANQDARSLGAQEHTAQEQEPVTEGPVVQEPAEPAAEIAAPSATGEEEYLASFAPAKKSKKGKKGKAAKVSEPETPFDAPISAPEAPQSGESEETTTATREAEPISLPTEPTANEPEQLQQEAEAEDLWGTAAKKLKKSKKRKGKTAEWESPTETPATPPVETSEPAVGDQDETSRATKSVELSDEPAAATEPQQETGQDEWGTMPSLGRKKDKKRKGTKFSEPEPPSVAVASAAEEEPLTREVEDATSLDTPAPVNPAAEVEPPVGEVEGPDALPTSEPADILVEPDLAVEPEQQEEAQAEDLWSMPTKKPKKKQKGKKQAEVDMSSGATTPAVLPEISPEPATETALLPESTDAGASRGADAEATTNEPAQQEVQPEDSWGISIKKPKKGKKKGKTLSWQPEPDIVTPTEEEEAKSLEAVPTEDAGPTESTEPREVDMSGDAGTIPTEADNIATQDENRDAGIVDTTPESIVTPDEPPKLTAKQLKKGKKKKGKQMDWSLEPDTVTPQTPEETDAPVPSGEGIPATAEPEEPAAMDRDSDPSTSSTPWAEDLPASKPKKGKKGKKDRNAARVLQSEPEISPDTADEVNESREIDANDQQLETEPGVGKVEIHPAWSSSLRQSPVLPAVGLGLIADPPTLYPHDEPSPKLLTALASPPLEDMIPSASLDASSEWPADDDRGVAIVEKGPGNTPRPTFEERDEYQGVNIAPNTKPEPSSRDFAAAFLEKGQEGIHDIKEHPEDFVVLPATEMPAASQEEKVHDDKPVSVAREIAASWLEHESASVKAPGDDAGTASKETVSRDVSLVGKDSPPSPKKGKGKKGRDEKDDSVDIKGAAAAGAAVGGVALLAQKFGGAKKKKGGKKKILDKRSAREDDMFDDPSLWEGADRKPIDGSRMDMNADNFWDVPQPAEEQPESSGGVGDDAFMADVAEERALEETTKPTTTREGRESPTVGWADSEPSNWATGRDVRQKDSTSPPPVERAFSFPEDIAHEDFSPTGAGAKLDRGMDLENSYDHYDQYDHHSAPRAAPRVSSINDLRHGLPSVQEEPSDGSEPEEHRTRQKGPVRMATTPDTNRDSGFVADSPRLHQRSRQPDEEPHRDSGVHLRDWPETTPTVKGARVFETQHGRALSPNLRDERHRFDTPKSGDRDRDRDKNKDKASTMSPFGDKVKYRAPKLQEPSPPPRTPEPQKVGAGKRPKQHDLGYEHAPPTTPGSGFARLATSPGQRSVSDSGPQHLRESPKPLEMGPRRVSSNTGITRLRTPEHLNLRPDSPGSMRSWSGTPPLRRVDKRVSGDLRSVSLSQRSQSELASDSAAKDQGHEKDGGGGGVAAALGLAAAASTALAIAGSRASQNTTPVANEGRVRAKDMTDVYVSLPFH